MSKTKPYEGRLRRIEFRDIYNRPCTIRERAKPEPLHLSLGADPVYTLGSRRVFLTREMLAELLPELQHFVDTGRLSEKGTPDE